MPESIVASIVNRLIRCFANDKKLMICGNGGSAAEAQHFAGELVCSFMDKEREPLPAIALTTDTSIITAWSNDFSDGFEKMFSRQIEALGQSGDCLVVLSTSGRSKNCLSAIKTAKRMGIYVIDFPRDGKDTAEIQENQLRLIHEVCRRLDRYYSG